MVAPTLFLMIFGAEVGFIAAQVPLMNEMLSAFYDGEETSFPIPPPVEELYQYVLCGLILGALCGLGIFSGAKGRYYYKRLLSDYDHPQKMKGMTELGLMTGMVGIWAVAFVLFIFMVTPLAFLLPFLYVAVGIFAVVEGYEALYEFEYLQPGYFLASIILALALIEFQTHLFGLGRFSMYSMAPFAQAHNSSLGIYGTLEFRTVLPTTARFVFPLLAGGMAVGSVFLLSRQLFKISSSRR